jgi:hypothetical protein
MPSRVLALTLVLLFAFGNAAALASGPAPADEYFGPFKESVLEIRNRLLAFERDANSNLARNVRAIDNLEVTIEDWYRRYPRDPWIPGFASRLVRVYGRAHAWRDRYCDHVRRIARARR